MPYLSLAQLARVCLKEGGARGWRELEGVEGTHILVEGNGGKTDLGGGKWREMVE